MAEEGLIELLAKLVSIPSVNPEDTDDKSITGEADLAEFFATYLEELGFVVAYDEPEPGRPNVIAWYGDANAPKSVLFESHLDTVSVKGMKRLPFAAEIENGRLYGRGACDTKGPMAAAMWALKGCPLDRITGAGYQVVYVGAMGEEKGNQGAAHLVSKNFGADEAIILEPTELAVVRAHKGPLWFRVNIDGVPGHGSDPDNAVSAIRGASRLVLRLEELTAAAAKQHEDDLLGPPTVNVGLIEGGAAVNIVPPHCMFEVDRRSLPGEDHDEILNQVYDELATLKEEGEIASYSIDVTKSREAFRTTEDALLVSKLKDACTDCGLEGRVEGAAWYSDAGPFSLTCPEVAVFGPGSIKQAHTAEEYIELDSLQKGCDVLRRFLEKLAVLG